MSCALDHNSLVHHVRKAPPRQSAAVRGAVAFLRHIAGRLRLWAEAGDDAQVADLLARSGGRLTDDIEREMMRRWTTRNWSVHG